MTRMHAMRPMTNILLVTPGVVTTMMMMKYRDPDLEMSRDQNSDYWQLHFLQYAV